jgi:hypothetical protein
MGVNLSEDHYKKLGDLLSSAIHNKDHPHVTDLRRSSVLIFSLLQKGYYFHITDLEVVMRESGNSFSDTAKKDLQQITWVCNELVKGLENSENERFKLKDFV